MGWNRFQVKNEAEKRRISRFNAEKRIFHVKIQNVKNYS